MPAGTRACECAAAVALFREFVFRRLVASSDEREKFCSRESSRSSSASRENYCTLNERSNDDDDDDANFPAACLQRVTNHHLITTHPRSLNHPHAPAAPVTR